MQISGNTNSSALQTLQALINSMETGAAGSANSAPDAGQKVQGGQTASQSAGPLPPPLQSSNFSSQFAPASLAFLTSLQSSGSGAGSSEPVGMVDITQLDKGLGALSSALEQIESALNPGASSATATSSSSAASLTGTASVTSASLTSSISASATGLMNQGLIDVATALKEIEGSVTHFGLSATAPAVFGAGSAAATSTASTTSLTSTGALSALSQTSSLFATALNDLNTVLNSLEQAATSAPQHNHHHHHRVESAANSSTAGAATSSSASSDDTGATTNEAATG